MRRVIGFLFILAVIAALGLVIYAYVADLSAPSKVVETPAVGVGFTD
ncbi:MAG: hypothetical protein AAF360_17235 [Pseudomonadota bacterium]